MAEVAAHKCRGTAWRKYASGLCSCCLQLSDGINFIFPNEEEFLIAKTRLEQERALKATNKMFEENGSLECYKRMGSLFWWKYTVSGVEGGMCGPHPVDAILGDGQAMKEKD